MDLLARVRELLERVDPRLLAVAERALRRIPPVAERIERETDAMLASLEPSLKPYKKELETHDRIPETGVSRDEVLVRMRALHDREQARWREGFVSGAVYHGDPGHI